MSGGEEQSLVRRRSELYRAVAALDGERAQGTLVDHLAVAGTPRIPGTRRRIEEAREQLAKAERELERARRQVA